jgi:RNA polymerase sigma-70 factor (ECF subfamily)
MAGTALAQHLAASFTVGRGDISASAAYICKSGELGENDRGETPPLNDTPADVTLLLHRINNGERAAESQLMSAMLPELDQIARRLLRSESPGHSLQPTILVNELYLRAIRSTATRWRDREHFRRVAVRVMRHVLIDHARAKGAGRRPPAALRQPIDDVASVRDQEDLDGIIAVQELLDQLERHDPQLAGIIELRFFGGYTVDEIATVMDLAKSTVDKRYAFAIAWLRGRLNGSV